MRQSERSPVGIQGVSGEILGPPDADDMTHPRWSEIAFGVILRLGSMKLVRVATSRRKSLLHEIV